MYMDVLHVPMFVNHVRAWYPRRSDEGVRSCATRATDFCECSVSKLQNRRLQVVSRLSGTTRPGTVAWSGMRPSVLDGFLSL